MPVHSAQAIVQPYAFLYKTLTLLFVDDDPVLLELYQTHFSDIPVYRVFTAASSADACRIFKEHAPVNLCVQDMGITDMGDELFLIREYSPQTAFIVLTGCSSAEKGWLATAAGAKAVLDKPQGAFDLMPFAARYSVGNLLCPDRCMQGDYLMRRSVDALFDYSPKNVGEWQQAAGITDRYLRKIWRKYRKVPAHYALFLHRTYCRALSYMAQAAEDTEAPPVLDNAEHDRSREYFLANRRLLGPFYSVN
ncbi:MAG TPA: response regulator [Chitinivibrionales bacterium]|nr:response regulator [Chitinivibrionales bacterium]